MPRIKPSKLRQILWKVMKHGKRWWTPSYKFASGYRILNDSWVLNLRASIHQERAVELDILESQLNSNFQVPGG